MILLAIECSSEERSVAIARDGELLGAESRRMGRATPLLAMIQTLLVGANQERSAVERIAVGLGPGSYTGIRAAIALAQGWHQATGAGLAGIDSAEACALRAQAMGDRGNTAVVIDAQRGEWYIATYDLREDAPHPLSPLRLATRSEVDQLAVSGFRLVGPDLDRAGLPGRTISPDAWSVARLASRLAPATAPTLLEPIYLRATSFVKAPPARVVPGL